MLKKGNERTTERWEGKLITCDRCGRFADDLLTVGDSLCPACGRCGWFVGRRGCIFMLCGRCGRFGLWFLHSLCSWCRIGRIGRIPSPFRLCVFQPSFHGASEFDLTLSQLQPGSINQNQSGPGRRSLGSNYSYFMLQLFVWILLYKDALSLLKVLVSNLAFIPILRYKSVFLYFVGKSPAQVHVVPLAIYFWLWSLNVCRLCVESCFSVFSRADMSFVRAYVLFVLNLLFISIDMLLHIYSQTPCILLFRHVTAKSMPRHSCIQIFTHFCILVLVRLGMHDFRTILHVRDRSFNHLWFSHTFEFCDQMFGNLWFSYTFEFL